MTACKSFLSMSPDYVFLHDVLVEVSCVPSFCSESLPDKL